jgi:hypothetical protein
MKLNRFFFSGFGGSRLAASRTAEAEKAPELLVAETSESPWCEAARSASPRTPMTRPWWGSALNLAADDDHPLICRNPPARFKLPRIEPRPRTWWSSAHMRQFLEATLDHRPQAIGGSRCCAGCAAS